MTRAAARAAADGSEEATVERRAADAADTAGATTGQQPGLHTTIPCFDVWQHACLISLQPYFPFCTMLESLVLYHWLLAVKGVSR